MFKVYIAKDNLVNIFIDESDTSNHSDWYNVLCMQNVIGLDSYSDDEMLDPDSPIAIIRRNNANISFVNEHETFEDITAGNYKKAVEKNPCGAYILNVSKKEASDITKSYGVICESTSNLGDTFLTTKDFPVDKAKNGKTWDRFPFGKKIPTNTLVIQDRFFCNSDYGETINDTFENYEKILRALLPSNLSVPFHLMVIFDGKKIQARDQITFNDIAKQFNYIKEQIEDERQYSILLEVISIPEHSYNYDKTHNRRILSNYYWIEAPHKLKAFRGEQNLSIQSIVSKFLYATLQMPSNNIFEDGEPDSYSDNHSAWIATFKELMLAASFSGNYSDYNMNKRFPPITYDYSKNGVIQNEVFVNNRLFSQTCPETLDK